MHRQDAAITPKDSLGIPHPHCTNYKHVTYDVRILRRLLLITQNNTNITTVYYHHLNTGSPEGIQRILFSNIIHVQYLFLYIFTFQEGSHGQKLLIT